MTSFVNYFFAFSVGLFLIVAANQGVEIWTVAHGILSVMILFSAISSIIFFGAHGIFWKTVLSHLETFGPDADNNERALKVFEDCSEAIKSYRQPIIFYASFGGSLVLMSGLLMQGWYFTLVCEILGSAIGYGFIRYFQINRANILAQIAIDPEEA